MTRWGMICRIIKGAVSQIRNVLSAKPIKDIEDLACSDPWLRAEMEAFGQAPAAALSNFRYVLDDNSIATPSADAGRRR